MKYVWEVLYKLAQREGTEAVVAKDIKEAATLAMENQNDAEVVRITRRLPIAGSNED